MYNFRPHIHLFTKKGKDKIYAFIHLLNPPNPIGGLKLMYNQM